LRALSLLLEHDTLGQHARFERYAAELLFILAAGEHIDKDKAERFAEQVDRVYKNPFAAEKKEMNAEEIKQHISGRITALLNGG